MTKAFKPMRVGVVGTGRGFCLKNGLEAKGYLKIVANCDVNAHQNEAVRLKYGINQIYTDYEKMLDQADLDVVVVATPMLLHAEQAIMALKRGLHVISEVTAAVSVEECQALTTACKQSKAIYCLSENGLFIRDNAIVREVVRRGLFGKLYYAEGEYLHRWETPIKKVWQLAHTDINGVTYGTHPLGPILSWMPDDRVVSVCCAGSGHNVRDEKGRRYGQEDTCVMLCRLQSGGLIKIRQDILSTRPKATINYMLQGTDGAYESSRLEALGGKVWLKALCSDTEQWLDLEELVAEFQPKIFSHLAEVIKQDEVHLGNDCITGAICAEIVTGRRANDLDIHRAMDMTLPGLLSQQSIEQGGRWVDVPDSRAW